MDDKQKMRDRAQREEKISRFSDIDNGRDRFDEKQLGPRLYVTNFPPDTKWNGLKDFFRHEVGDGVFIQLIGPSVGFVEFSSMDLYRKALSLKHQLIYKGLKLTLSENLGKSHDLTLLRKERGGINNEMPRPPIQHRDKFNTYGLSVNFLENLEVEPPLVNRIFVSNLSYEVDANKLKEVFKLAGKIRSHSLVLDKDGKSKGLGLIRYDHPVEAVQAISMFHNQFLFNRKMGVKMDRQNYDLFKLPVGLLAIGPGLGRNGRPLEDISRNLWELKSSNKPQNNHPTEEEIPPQPQPPQMEPIMNHGNMMGNIPVAGLGMTNFGSMGGIPNINLANMGNFNLQALALLQSQLLQQNRGNDMSGSTNTATNSNMPNMGFGLNLPSDIASANQLSAVAALTGLIGGNAAPVGFNTVNTGPIRNDSNSMFQSGMMGGNQNMQPMNQKLQSVNQTMQPMNQNMQSTNQNIPSMNQNSQSMNQNMQPINQDMRQVNQNRNFNSNDFDQPHNKMPDMSHQNSSFNRADIKNDNSEKTKVSDMVIVDNLPPNITWQILHEKFGECGEVKFADLTGNNSAVVRFIRDWDAQRAVKTFNGTRIDGHVLNVRFY